jgi:AhpD family alkylhydroperoxidase
VREQIALAVAENNLCDYCLSAHTFLGKHAGLSDADAARARKGRAADLKADAAVRFAQSLLESHGHASDAELAAARQAGFSDGEIVEVVAIMALNVFTNYLNRVAETDIDFPVVRSGIGAAA